MKDTAKIRQQLHEILDICLDCNGFESRQKGSTGTLPTVFMDFSGHVGKVDIRLYPDGWSSAGFYKEFEFTTDKEESQGYIDSFRAYAMQALTSKKESEVLSRDIEAQEQTIKAEREKLANLKKSYKKAIKKEGAA